MENVTEATFSESIKRSTLTFVDFWAPWCQPCKAMLPALEAFAASNPQINVVKVNVDEQSELAKKWGVRGIPSIMVFKDGERIASKTGTLTQNQLQALLENI
jgi:thioredoxin 1